MSGGKAAPSEVVLRSDILYLGDIRVSDSADSLNLRSGRRIKDLLQPVVFWFLKNAPSWLAVAPLQIVSVLAMALYWLPGNPLRLACTYVSQLALPHGFRHRPWQLYRRFLGNIVTASRGYRSLLRGGPEAVVDRIELRDEDQRKMDEALDAYGGAIVACPHNPGSAFASLRMNQTIPMIAVMKNSATVRRTRLALEAFERMQVRLLMVRSGNPFELSRAMFTALKDRLAIAATVDNIDTTPGAVNARIFGIEIGFAPWAAKIAAKKKVPIVPSYYRSRGDEIVADFGEPLVTSDLQQALQHYVSFFEQKILEDPASWAYLADRKWRRALRHAAQAMNGNS